MRLRSLGFFCVVAGLAGAPGAFGQTYANLAGGTLGNPGAVVGTLAGDGLVYSGDVYGLQTSTGVDSGFGSLAVNGQNPWIPTSTYTSAGVPNAPTDGAIIAINTSGTNTVQFVGAPVSNLIMDVFSMGSGTQNVGYTFNHTFEVLSCGANAYFGGGCFTQGVGSIGTTLSGNEANGMIEFFGDISDLTFTVDNAETFSGFDFGQAATAPPAPTPEPSSLILLGSGLLTGAGVLRRRFVRK